MEDGFRLRETWREEGEGRSEMIMERRGKSGGMRQRREV